MRKLYIWTRLCWMKPSSDPSDQAWNPCLLHVLPGSTLHSTPTFYRFRCLQAERAARTRFGSSHNTEGLK